MKRTPIPASGIITASLLAALRCLAQSNEPSTDHSRDAAAAYEIRAGSAAGPKLQFRPQHILPWTNPVPEKQMHGHVFVWTDDGRPAAVLNVFKMEEGAGPQEYHEFCSLYESGLNAVSPSGREWKPAVSQVTMSSLPLESSQGRNGRQRLAQMRELASRFTCQKTNRKGDIQILRLLSQPLLRYESKSHGVLDGALFAFVEATDPEAFLLLELHTVDDMTAWRFGFARLASVQMHASLDDKKVWKVETLPYSEYRNRPDLPYTLLMVR
jgi:hypothetical protein